MVKDINEKRKSGRPKQPITKEEILLIATDVFAQAGYAGASMNEMATRAGLRKASLFHHFPNKEALYTGVLERALVDLARMAAEVDMPDAGFLEQLDHLGGTLVTYLGSNGNIARLLMREIVEGNSFSKGAAQENILTILNVTAAFLESGMEEGAIERQDPKQLLLSIVGLHLTYFATAELSSSLLGADVFSPAQIEARVAAVLAQVRRLCGAK